MVVSEPAAVELLTSVSRLVRTARTYAHLRNQQLGRAGLPLGILTRLHAPLLTHPSHPGMTRPGDLATALGVSPSAVSRAVAGLVEAGFVVRTADPSDARACALTLTAAGTVELQHLHHEQARAVSGLLDGWDDAKAGILSELLDELCTGLSGPVRHHLPLPYAGSSPAVASSGKLHGIPDRHGIPASSDTPPHDLLTHQTVPTDKTFG